MTSSAFLKRHLRITELVGKAQLLRTIQENGFDVVMMYAFPEEKDFLSNYDTSPAYIDWAIAKLDKSTYRELRG